MASEMVKEKMIDGKTAIGRVSPSQLDELLHPIVDPNVEKNTPLLAKGLPAGPGGATGKVVFTAQAAVDWAAKGEKVVLVREETNPEDVVAGIRTPNPLNEVCRTEHSGDLASLEQSSPHLYKELDAIRLNLEKHYSDMLDIEFTIQSGKLWMLQCRIGKRNGPAAIRMASEMVKEKMINGRTAIGRVTPSPVSYTHLTLPTKA